MQRMSTELDLQHLAKENPKFCIDCQDHGLLALRREAVQRMRWRKRKRNPGNDNRKIESCPESQNRKAESGSERTKLIVETPQLLS